MRFYGVAIQILYFHAVKFYGQIFKKFILAYGTPQIQILYNSIIFFTLRKVSGVHIYIYIYIYEDIHEKWFVSRL